MADKEQGLFKEVIVSTNCEACDAHKTDLGTLKEIERIVNENFPDWTQKQELIIALYNNYKSDERMYYIEKSKNKTTERIQSFKEKNMRSMHKEA